LEPVLSVRNLTIALNQRSDKTLVKGLCFEIKRGETIALVGESGSGKTLTALGILRLLPPEMIIKEGEITLQNKQGSPCVLTNCSTSELHTIRGSEIAMIFQDPGVSLNPVLKCGHQVSETILTHEQCTRHQAKTKTLEIFREVQLDPIRTFNAYPHELSGGQRQRVMIAMAISGNPTLILADEPTSALDAPVQKGVLTLLKKVQEKYRIAILLISHDLDLVKNFADRVMVMHQGRIIEDKAVGELFESPGQAYTKALLTTRPERAAGAGFPYTSAETFVNVRNLSVRFEASEFNFFRKNRHINAVDSVSFDVYKGETLGLVGESGSGKTSLGRALLRLIEPREGLIKIGHLEVNALEPKKLRQNRNLFQMVFQDPYASLNPFKTIGEALTEPLTIFQSNLNEKERKQKAIHFLELTGLHADHYKRLPNTFSGGQRQRICIARALILEPEFLVLDEPVSSLDVAIQAQILQLLNKLKETLRFTSLFISHDLDLIRCISDRIMVMKNGKIEEIAETETLFQNPKAEYTKILLDSLPRSSPISSKL